MAPIRATHFLLGHDAQVAQSGALQIAASKGRLDVLEALIAYGGKVYERLISKVGFLGNRGKRSTRLEAAKTPVQIAIEHGNSKIATWLLEKGADSSSTDPVSGQGT